MFRTHRPLIVFLTLILATLTGCAASPPGSRAMPPTRGHGHLLAG